MMKKHSNDPRKRRRRPARAGDIVTIHLQLDPENGFVPEPLFDSHGRISFVLGWGNYLPGLHECLVGRRAGDAIPTVSLDAGWGARRSDLVVSVPRQKLPGQQQNVVKGDTLQLQGGRSVLVVNVTPDSVVLDANPPLAGSSYACTAQVLAVEEVDNERYQVATFALGCFWGAELLFMRVPGVVSTKVGYSQGITVDPTYEQVCAGTTQHRESVLVVYDTRVVSYRQLLQTALDRLRQVHNPLLSSSANHKTGKQQENSDSFRSVVDVGELFRTDDDEDDRQYRHGVYYHSPEQLEVAKSVLTESDKSKYGIELLKASIFYDAEESHQQYLYKGGQSTRKGCKETIRCFG